MSGSPRPLAQALRQAVPLIPQPPSVSGAGDQEVDSHPGPSRVPKVTAAVRVFAEEVKEEILFRLTDSLVAPLRDECDTGFQ